MKEDLILAASLSTLTIIVLGIAILIAKLDYIRELIKKIRDHA